MTDNRMYAGKSSQARAEERQHRLKQAALHVIGTEGYRAATVRKVCAQAGLTSRYFYEAFTSTEDMLIQVYREQISRLESSILSAITPAQTAQEAIALGTTALFGFVREHTDATRVLLVEILGVSSTVDKVYQQGTLRFVDVLVEVARTWPRNDELSDEDIRLMGVAAVGATVHMMVQWLLSGFSYSVLTMSRNLARVLTGIFVQAGLPEA